MMKKVLVVTNMYPTKTKPQWGTFVYEQVESLRKQYGNELHIDVYLVNGAESKFNYLKSLLYLPFIVSRGKYDLVHVHYGLTLISALLIFKPVIVTYHGTDLLAAPGKYIPRLLKFKPKRSIVVSNNLKKKLGFGTVIPCGIDVGKFIFTDKSPLYRKRESEKNRPLRILFPSSPSNKIKNYPLFHDVCIELNNSGFEVEEVFLANIPREKVPSIFWSCDAMILTSYSEGSPTVVKEAIAAKLPFVSVDVGDVSEWCRHISFGAVVPSRSAKAIADKLIQVLSEADDREGLDNLNVIDQIDLHTIARKIKQIYDAVMT